MIPLCIYTHLPLPIQLTNHTPKTATHTNRAFWKLDFCYLLAHARGFDADKRWTTACEGINISPLMNTWCAFSYKSLFQRLKLLWRLSLFLSFSWWMVRKLQAILEDIWQKKVLSQRIYQVSRLIQTRLIRTTRFFLMSSSGTLLCLARVILNSKAPFTQDAEVLAERLTSRNANNCVFRQHA